MKLKMYFLASNGEVISGPYFTMEQAYRAKIEKHPLMQPLLKIYKSNGKFDLEEV